MKGVLGVSFVIPTYNRPALTIAAVRSALTWLGHDGDGEIVVVDDGSTDGTLGALEAAFEPQIRTELLRVIRRPSNGGVIRAKNDGVCAARGQWVIFLDSDDEMIPDSAPAVRAALDSAHDFPMVFFRCIDLVTGTPLGPPQTSPVEVSLVSYLRGQSYGECLPAVRRSAAASHPYDERLNGWEGLAYARIMRDVGPLQVSPVVARRYRQTGDDRLSSVAGMRRRRGTLARGHWLLLREFWRFLSPAGQIRQIGKAVYYWLAARL